MLINKYNLYKKQSDSSVKTIQDINIFAKFLHSNFHQAPEVVYPATFYYIDTYSDEDIHDSPAYWIKNPAQEENEIFAKKREEAKNYYLSKLVSIFERAPNLSTNLLAMYIPSSKTNIKISNCGLVIKELCKKISWMEDGTSYIQRIKDIPAKHETGQRSKQSETLEISNIRNRNIILFDDRITTGDTAKELVALLKANGANHVFFIAFTQTDGQIKLVKQNIQSPTFPYYKGVMNVLCKWHTVALWKKISKKGLIYYQGHSEDNNNISIRIFRSVTTRYKLCDFYGFIDSTEIKFSISLWQQDDNNLMGKVKKNAPISQEDRLQTLPPIN